MEKEVHPKKDVRACRVEEFQNTYRRHHFIPVRIQLPAKLLEHFRQKNSGFRKSETLTQTGSHSTVESNQARRALCCQIIGPNLLDLRAPSFWNKLVRIFTPNFGIVPSSVANVSHICILGYQNIIGKSGHARRLSVHKLRNWWVHSESFVQHRVQVRAFLQRQVAGKLLSQRLLYFLKSWY